jgi:hypothetical protein
MKKNVIIIRNPVFEWENQAKQYPCEGTGIVYFKGIISDSIWVDCLLYYGDDNSLQGILNHYPVDVPPDQKSGSVNIQVRSDKRRTGIATVLLNEGINRFKINLKNQEYTHSGERFIQKFMRTSTTYRLSLQKFRFSKAF